MNRKEVENDLAVILDRLEHQAQELTNREQALKADYDKRLADSTADLRRNAVQSAAQLKDANAQVKELQDKVFVLEQEIKRKSK